MKLFSLFLLVISLTALATPSATFRDSYVRYVSEHDLFRLLQQKFPDANWNTLPDCNALSDSNGTALGVPNPASGELTYPGPSESFAAWYFKCLMAGVSNEMNHATTTQNGMDTFLGREAIKSLQKDNLSKIRTAPQSVPWKTLDSRVQHQITRNLIHIYIGPNILKNEWDWTQKLASAVSGEPSFSTLDAVKQIIMLVASQNEFLSY